MIWKLQDIKRIRSNDITAAPAKFGVGFNSVFAVTA
jgi:hypothetical protein